MITATFLLNGRQKIITADNFTACVKNSLKNLNQQYLKLKQFLFPNPKNKKLLLFKPLLLI